jgi:hypothetical protein
VGAGQDGITMMNREDRFLKQKIIGLHDEVRILEYYIKEYF